MNKDINEEQEIQKTSYSPFKSEDKFYFGGFLNLAYNNISEVFGELQKRLHIEARSKNFIYDDVNQMFKEEAISLYDYEQHVKAIADYFPAVKYFDLKNETTKKRITYFKKTLTAFLKAIEDLRNYYTHYHHNQINIAPIVFEILDKILLDTAFTVKKKHIKTDKTKELLKKNFQEELNHLYSLKLNHLIQKQKNNKSFKFDKSKDAIIASIYNDAFMEYIDDRENTVKLKEGVRSKYNEKSYPKKEADDLDIPFSQNGLVFLLSLFLSSKEIEDLKANIKGFKGKKLSIEDIDLKTNSIRFMVTHRIYSFWSYKGLKRKIRSSHIEYGNAESNLLSANIYGKDSLLMQMLDELSKVPDVVYNNLDDNHKQTFVEDLNEFYKDNAENAYTLEGARVVHPIIRKRYEDKFNYFAIRFLDEFAGFPTLRFQIHLGNYIHRTDKKNTNGIMTDRQIKEKITVFGRLSEVEKAKANFFVDKENIGDNGWEIFPNPGYNFPKENISINDKKFPQDDYQQKSRLPNAAKIGIKLKLSKKYEEIINDAVKEIRGSQKRKGDKILKQMIISQIISINGANQQKPIVSYGQPTAYLSLNDIHSLLYEFLKPNGKTGEELEKMIVEKIERQIEQTIDKEQPSRMLKKHIKQQSLTGNINKDKLLKDIEREKEVLQQLQSEQKNRQQEFKDKNRKYLLYDQEKGKIAVWLANDIKRFMPQDFKDKWRGYMHRELQKALAYYDLNHVYIRDILKGLNFKNTILSDIENCLKKENTLNDFYNEYLRLRLEHINGLISSVKNNQDNPKAFKSIQKECFKFINKKNYTVSSSIDSKIKTILTHPIFLERGFVDNKPTMIKGTDFEKNKNLFAEWFVYYKDYDNYQDFYDTELYPLIIEAGNDKDDKESASKHRKISKAISKQQKNDVFTLMMAKYILKNIFEHQEIDCIELKDLYQSRRERLQNQAHSIQTQEPNKNFIWNKTLDVKILGKIIAKNVKLKDIGSFRKYETDSRITTILEYQPEISEWEARITNESNSSVRNIERQINSYEAIRCKKLLKEVQILEKHIYDNVADKTVIQNNGDENFRKYIKEGLLKTMLGIDLLNGDEDTQNTIKYADILIEIRNKFAHNQMPNKDYFDSCRHNCSKIDENETYAEYFLRVFKNLKYRILQR